MKIKKPAKADSSATSSSGEVAIAGRFKLDQVAPSSKSSKNGTINKNAALTALIAGCISLALVGILTYVLYQHWQYLMPA